MNRLELRSVDMHYGSLHVTRDVSLRMVAGERMALIGPNGAGKTTLVNIIAGSVRHSAGEVLYEGQDIGGLSVSQRARRGLVRTFQISRLFMGMTVEDNVRVAALHSEPGTRAPAREVDAIVARGMAQLQITHLAGKLVDALSLGERRLVELSLALTMQPRLLLLDEPAAGIPHGESRHVLQAVNALPSDLSVMLIEHDMDLVFSWARRIVVLAGGAIVKDGDPESIANDDYVQRIYFGRADT
jgi:branched-chain amino acid transport system ATP-binding protein